MSVTQFAAQHSVYAVYICRLLTEQEVLTAGLLSQTQPPQFKAIDVGPERAGALWRGRRSSAGSTSANTKHTSPKGFNFKPGRPIHLRGASGGSGLWR